MVELNYGAIVQSLCEGYSDKMNEWESTFMNDMLLRNDYDNLTEAQKKKVREINRKYRCTR